MSKARNNTRANLNKEAANRQRSLQIGVLSFFGGILLYSLLSVIALSAPQLAHVVIIAIGSCITGASYYGYKKVQYKPLGKEQFDLIWLVTAFVIAILFLYITFSTEGAFLRNLQG